MAARRTYALAYDLTMFHGFGASAFLDTSRDRLMGILFGLLTTAIVFDVLGTPKTGHRWTPFQMSTEDVAW